MYANGTATQFTQTGVRNMSNRKPYRTKALKAQAKAKARKTKDGTFRTRVVPVLYHPPVADGSLV